MVPFKNSYSVDRTSLSCDWDSCRPYPQKVEEVGVGKVFAFAVVYIVWYAKAIPFCMSKVIPFCMCEGLCEKKSSVWKGEKACAISTESGGGGCRESVFGFAAVYIVWYAKAIPFCMSKVIILSCRKLYLFVCRFFGLCVYVESETDI